MYDNLNEKERDFECKTIDTIEKLKEFIESQNNYQPQFKSLSIGVSTDDFFKRKHYIIYRGIKESKFCLNTSLQFRWNEITHFHPDCTQAQYLSTMVSRLVNNPHIKEYITKDGKSYTCISILALMQHYGLPTPLLDWTPNIETGLNFAYDGIDLTPQEEDISNYVSLYYIDLFKNYELQSSSYQGVLADCCNRLCKYDLSHADNLNNAKLKNIFTLDDLDLDFFYIDYSEDEPLVEDIFGNVLSLINPNLEIQDGAFIVNFRPDNNLDYYWNKKMSDHDTEILSEKHTIKEGVEIYTTVSENQNAKGIIPKTKINCANIKKSVLASWIDNGGKRAHYDESQESQILKENVLKTYYRWLLDGDKDFEFFRNTFVNNAKIEERQVAEQVLKEYEQTEWEQ